MVKDQVYIRIAESVDRGPQRAPKVNGELSKAFIDYLKLIYTPKEAEVVQYLEMLPRLKTVEQVAEDVEGDATRIKEILDALDQKDAIINVGDNYCLPVIFGLLNYHQHNQDVRPNDLEAARLYQDFFIKEGFYKYCETSVKGTPITRAIPVGRAIAKEEKILTAEEAHGVINGLKTNDLALVPCPCRTRTEKLGIRECKDQFPIASCIIIGPGAKRFEAHGLGKMVTKEQAIKYLDEMQDLGLVANTDNYTNPNQTVICLCCGCCCSMVRGRTRWDNPDAVLPSNFVPQAGEDCILCETCLDRCFFGALSIDEDAGRVVCDPEKCIGCGICTITCPQETLKLHRFERSIPFSTSMELWKTIYTENKSS